MKRYLDLDVYLATQKRLEFIFATYENVYVSFSGGKDSGLLLNLAIDFKRARNIKKKIGVFIQDFEAQFTETNLHIKRMIEHCGDEVEVFLCAMPYATECATSMFQTHWYPWHPDQEDLWCHPMPSGDHVHNLCNHSFDFWKDGMSQENFYKEFGPWYQRRKGGGSTVGLVGIRADESLNRFRAVTKDSGNAKHKWITANSDTMHSAYPIYDWSTKDVWVANSKHGYDYNKLYDLFHLAGLSIDEMRVASPYNSHAFHSINLFRTIEPNLWGKVVGRVNGANFAALYGGTSAVGYKSVKLPDGHSWRTYTKFLLSTLPEATRNNYQQKFIKSIQFWGRKGGVLCDETIRQLQDLSVNHKESGQSPHKTSKTVVRFPKILDDADSLEEHQSVPSWKRMAICILKNDHSCKYMGFSPTKEQLTRQKKAMEMYLCL